MAPFITIPIGRSGALLSLAFAILCPGSARAGDIVLDVTSTVINSSTSTSSVFAGVVAGDVVRIHLELWVPGVDLVPGHETVYTFDAASSYLEIGGVHELFIGSLVDIHNDVSAGDLININPAVTLNNGFVSMEVRDATGTVFGSTDVTAELGTWPSSTWSSFYFGYFDDPSGILTDPTFIDFARPVISISDPQLGINYCGPAVPNSTGASGSVRASGSTVVSSNRLGVLATNLPPFSFGLAITSRTQGFILNPGGSQGHLCVSGSVGRFIGQIQNASAAGEIHVAVDLTRIPQPGGPVAGVPGDSWSFQCWYRDANPITTSNFTDAVEVILE